MLHRCDAFDDLLEAGYIIDEQAKLNLCKNWIFYIKEFYRNGYIAPNDNCTATDSDGEYSVAESDLDCVQVCSDSSLSQLKSNMKHILNSDYTTVDSDMTDDGWTAWLSFICGGSGSLVFGGDHLESASPADPSFWPIHPTLERLLHAKYMTASFDTDEWATDAVNDYVCNKAKCYDTELADDDSNGFGYYEHCCYGHYQDDQILDASSGDRFSGIGPTNREMMTWTNPTTMNYTMGYVYDGFTWDHCSSTGYDIVALLDTLYANFTNATTSTNRTTVEVSDGKGW